MDNLNKKCSSKEHKNIDCISFCQECKIYMCNKCINFHSILFENHHSYNLDEYLKEDIFTGYCKEDNHLEKLEYYCKDHNILCCASCICKIKGKGKGEHNCCNIFFIEDIKNEKKKKFRK